MQDHSLIETKHMTCQEDQGQSANGLSADNGVICGVDSGPFQGDSQQPVAAKAGFSPEIVVNAKSGYHGA